MINKDKVEHLMNIAMKTNELVMSDTILGECSDTADGWIRCHYQTMKMLLEDIWDVIINEEDDF